MVNASVAGKRMVYSTYFMFCFDVANGIIKVGHPQFCSGSFVLQVSLPAVRKNIYCNAEAKKMTFHFVLKTKKRHLKWLISKKRKGLLINLEKKIGKEQFQIFEAD